MIIIYEVLLFSFAHLLVTESFWPWKNFRFAEPTTASEILIRTDFFTTFQFPGSDVFIRVWRVIAMKFVRFCQRPHTISVSTRWNFRFETGTREGGHGRSFGKHEFVCFVPYWGFLFFRPFCVIVKQRSISAENRVFKAVGAKIIGSYWFTGFQRKARSKRKIPNGGPIINAYMYTLYVTGWFSTKRREQ